MAGQEHRDPQMEAWEWGKSRSRAERARYSGKWVAVLDRQAVAVDSDLQSLHRRLREQGVEGYWPIFFTYDAGEVED